jgi:kojibiose phosphorylase/nigerose phosphorylase
MTAIEGFAGIHLENGILKAVPGLPSNWEKMLFKVIYRGDLYQIEITKDHAEVINLST